MNENVLSGVARDTDGGVLSYSYLTKTRWKAPLPPKMRFEYIDGDNEGIYSLINNHLMRYLTYIYSIADNR